MNSHCLLVGRARCGSLATAAVLSLATVLSSSGMARAADPSAPAPATATPAAATPTTPQSANVKEATARFERALALYDDGDFDAALVEFNRAYELQPSYKILYNIGKIERVKNDYSAALTYFRRYLEQGGAAIAPERREEVEKEIAVLKDRVALVTVQANVAGAVVYIDDVPLCGARAFDPNCVDTTPLPGPVVVNPGKRKITAVKQGFQNAYAQLTLAGGDQSTVKLDLFDLRPPAHDTAPRDRAIVAWSVTGALAIGAGVMGGITLGKKSKYDEDRMLPPCENQTVNSNSCLTDPAGTLESDKKSVQTFAIITDVLIGAAVVGAGVSIYLTTKAVNKATEPEQHADHFKLQNVKLTAGPGSAVLSGAF